MLALSLLRRGVDKPTVRTPVVKGVKRRKVMDAPSSESEAAGTAQAYANQCYLWLSSLMNALQGSNLEPVMEEWRNNAVLDPANKARTVAAMVSALPLFLCEGIDFGLASGCRWP